MQQKELRRRMLFTDICVELDRAYEKHGDKPWSRHELYGILKEKVDELWDSIKADAPSDKIREELTHVAAMCFRYFETSL